MQAANRFLTDLRASKLSLGIWQFFPAPSVSRTLARCKGINWILIDKEHGNVADSGTLPKNFLIVGCAVKYVNGC